MTFSITYVWQHLKTTFSDLNEQKKILEKLEVVKEKPEFFDLGIYSVNY